MKIVVTGAGGFIGRALCKELLLRGNKVRALVRDKSVFDFNFGLNENKEMLEIIQQEDISAEIYWPNLLTLDDYKKEALNSSAKRVVDCVIHCAARAHIFNETTSESMTHYRGVNVLATENLAMHAAALGVKRFIFISSIGVHGDNTNCRGPFSLDDELTPLEQYAFSKLEAEKLLLTVASQTGMEVVIVRPPLVYGPGAKGNMRRLLKLVQSGLPLPFGAINNRRSFISIDNLVDFIILCSHHSEAAQEIFLVSDDDDISIPEFINHIAYAMGRLTPIFTLPLPLLFFFANIIKLGPQINKIVSNLQIDIHHAKEKLGWSPKISTHEGIIKMVKNFYHEKE